MLRVTLGAACAVLVIGTPLTLAAPPSPAAPLRCAADASACAARLPDSRAVVRGEVARLGVRPSSVVLEGVRVTTARPAVRAAVRRARALQVVVPTNAVIVVRDAVGDEAEVYRRELLDAVAAGVEMDARVTGRASGTGTRPVIRATRMVVRVEDLADVLPIEDDEAVDEPVGEEDGIPVEDEAPVDEGFPSEVPA